MAVQLYNTLTRNKEAFKEIEPGKVRFYSCGPTVHDFAHIGNFRAFIAFDIIKRYLRYRGYDVMHVMNITDVDDKTIRGAQSAGVGLQEYTDRYTRAFLDDLAALNIEPADLSPRATDHIAEMVELVTRMIEDGFAYRREGSVYFSIAKFPTYGQLAHMNMDDLQAGASGVDADEYDKDDARDFVVWKAWQPDDGDVFWETDLGKGRPGWHLECSCMAMKYLGQTVDIHSGGVDLIFPHHQNEIAQSEAVTGQTFANYWVHNAFVNIDSEKMSKSLGNYLRLQDIAKTPAETRAFRYLVATSHYRTPLNFTQEAIDGAGNTMERLTRFGERLSETQVESGGDDLAPAIDRARDGFVAHMDDDLNTPRAIASVFGLVNEVDGLIAAGRLDRGGAEMVEAFLEEINGVLGIFYRLPEEDDAQGDLPEDLESLIAERESAREARDWVRADEIRDQLLEQGILLEDTPEGTVWRRA